MLIFYFSDYKLADLINDNSDIVYNYYNINELLRQQIRRRIYKTTVGRNFHRLVIDDLDIYESHTTCRRHGFPMFPGTFRTKRRPPLRGILLHKRTAGQISL